MKEKVLLDWLKGYKGKPLRLMEVCGTHTAALYRTGLRQLLPKNITLLSGPGCPVCVTPSSYIDKLIEYAQKPGYKVLTFGDMLAVPGSESSLAKIKAQGGQVDFFYTPEEGLQRARENPQLTFVLAAVGFETTAPIWATIVKQVAEEGLTNVRFLTALKTMPQAIAGLCERGNIDGFLCPGHVAVITGEEPFKKLGETYGKPMVIGGFTGVQLVIAMSRLALEANRANTGVWNEYKTVVKEHGNLKAQERINEVFEPDNAMWRGLGELEASGLYLRPEYAFLDAGSRPMKSDKLPAGCQCGRVLLGEIQPIQCPCFGKACTPEHPVGACMVSSEGSCCITYREGDGEE